MRRLPLDREIPRLPLARDLLQQLEEGTGERLNPEEFYGVQIRRFPAMSVEEIGRTLGPAFEYSDPDQHTEKVRFFDVVGRHQPWDTRVGAPLTPGVHTIELVRQAFPGRAVGVLETIATWLRISAQSEETNLVVEFHDGVILAPTVAQGSPFPFPFAHPDGGTISVRYTLIREAVACAGFGGQPAFAGPQSQPVEIIPTDQPLLTPWEDQRFPWTDSSSGNLSFVFGERCLLRLFATITITQNPWTVQIAGRLAGYHTITGYLKRALSAATERH